MLQAIPLANNDESMTPTLIDLLETIQSYDLTTICSSEQSATAGTNELDCPINYDAAMPSG